MRATEREREILLMVRVRIFGIIRRGEVAIRYSCPTRLLETTADVEYWLGATR